jgi:penicillin-binding protein 2
LKATHQWFKEIPVELGRGKIYDRNLIPLTNRTNISYLIIFPKHFERKNDTLKLISNLTKIPINDLKKDKRFSKTQPIKLEITNYDIDCLKKVIALKGVFPIDYSERYNHNGIASHIIGYINKIDNTGAKGIEKQYDTILKENQFKKFGAIVDAQKRIIPGFGYATLQPSHKKIQKNIITTLDYQIQKIVEETFDKKYTKGSIIVLDAKSGKVLAMTSRPNYDQNNVAAFLNNTDNELYNRAIQVAYPPGSIFKIVVAAAALENETTNIKDTFTCRGYETIGDTTIKCESFENHGHGTINLEQAFAISCNSVFIQLAQKIGREKILFMTKKFGFGTLTGIELPEEVYGKLPSKEYLKGAGIGNIAIGQGTLEATPIQIARMTAIIANNGIDNGISLIEKIVDEQKNTIKIMDKKHSSKIISIRTAKKIQNLMSKVVTEGTANNIKLNNIGGAAGKTGSAQAVSDRKKTVHAWFTGYFPYKNPKYVITIIVENGKSGRITAAPLFQEIAQKIWEVNSQ